MKKVGIFSGTFDPIHNGHIAFAEHAMKQCGLDKIFFLVEPQPRRKQGVRAFEHRVGMLKLAIADQSAFGSIVLDHPQFSVAETLPLLQNRFKGSELYLLLGEDVLNNLADWPHIHQLFTGTHFIIGARTQTPENITKLIETIAKTRGLPLSFEIISTPDIGVSSSKVRTALRNGQVSSDVHPLVTNYIKKHRLYHS